MVHKLRLSKAVNFSKGAAQCSEALPPVEKSRGRPEAHASNWQQCSPQVKQGTRGQDVKKRSYVMCEVLCS